MPSCSGADDAAGRWLSGAEIEALFSDRTVRGHHEVHGYDFSSYYRAEGTFRSHQSGKPKPRAARWWVAGDDICIEWNDTPGSLCRGMTLDDDGRYRKVLDVGGTTKRIVSFVEFTPGNPDNL